MNDLPFGTVAGSSVSQVAFWVATLGGLGFLPMAGLVANVMGLAWIYGVSRKLSYWTWILVGQLGLGVVVLSLAARRADGDPSMFVLDEFLAAGILLLGSRRWPWLLLGLVLYGVLDLMKPVARLAEPLPGGFGVLGDDVVSAALATITILLMSRTVRRRSSSENEEEK